MATYTDAIGRNYDIGCRYDNAIDYSEDANKYGWIKYRIVARRISQGSLYCFKSTTPVRCGKENLIRFIFDLALYDTVFAKVDNVDEVVYLTIVPEIEFENIKMSVFD